MITSDIVKTDANIKKFDKTHRKQKEIDERIIDWVACDLCPLETIQSTMFNKLIYACEPQYKIASRGRFRKQISQRAQTLKVSLKASFESVKSVCATADLWSNNQMRAYLGVTVHWITADWKLHSTMLACRRFRGRHTGENICRVFSEIMREYGLQDKVQSVLTDNASNMVKGFSLPSMSEVTVDVNNDMPENTTSEEEDGDEICEAIEQTSDNEDESSSTVKPMAISIDRQHQSCFAHTLQLCIKDGLGEAATSPMQRVWQRLLVSSDQ